jgi:hypothetical protein
MLAAVRQLLTIKHSVQVTQKRTSNFLILAFKRASSGPADRDPRLPQILQPAHAMIAGIFQHESNGF